MGANKKYDLTFIGLNIKTLRERQGMSQQVLADKVGINQATLSNYEVGKSGASLNSLFAVADALGVHVSVVMAEPQRCPTCNGIWFPDLSTSEDEVGP